MKIAIFAAIMGAVALAGAESAPAQSSFSDQMEKEILLTSADGTVRFRGAYAGFQTNAYVIRYHGYELLVPAANMRCEGVDCFTFEQGTADIQSRPDS